MIQPDNPASKAGDMYSGGNPLKAKKKPIDEKADHAFTAAIQNEQQPGQATFLERRVTRFDTSSEAAAERVRRIEQMGFVIEHPSPQKPGVYKFSYPGQRGSVLHGDIDVTKKTLHVADLHPNQQKLTSTLRGQDFMEKIMMLAYEYGVETIDVDSAEGSWPFYYKLGFRPTEASRFPEQDQVVFLGGKRKWDPSVWTDTARTWGSKAMRRALLENETKVAIPKSQIWQVYQEELKELLKSRPKEFKSEAELQEWAIRFDKLQEKYLKIEGFEVFDPPPATNFTPRGGDGDRVGMLLSSNRVHAWNDLFEKGSTSGETLIRHVGRLSFNED